MSRESIPENGAEKIYRVCGVECLAISEWNEHYIKEDNIKDIIIFDVTSSIYISWQEFLKFEEFNDVTKKENPEFFARKALKRLRYKVWKPVNSITKKMVAKTKRKITRNWSSNFKD